MQVRCGVAFVRFKEVRIGKRKNLALLPPSLSRSQIFEPKKGILDFMLFHSKKLKTFSRSGEFIENFWKNSFLEGVRLRVHI